MEHVKVRNIVLVGFGVVLMLGLRWVSSHLIAKKESVATAGFSYEMPRPHGYTGNFDLSGREIERDVLESKDNSAADAAAATAAANKALSQKSPLKKEATKTAANHESKVSISVVDTSTKSSMTEFQRMASQDLTAGSGSGSVVVLPPPATAKKADDGKPATKSAADWKALLTSQPSAANATQFVSAHLSGDVIDADFYSITFELLGSSNSQTQSEAVTILTADTSSSELIYVLKEESTVAASVKALLTPVIAGFAQVQKFPAVTQALKSGVADVVSGAMQVLTEAVQAAQQVTTQGNGGTTTVTGPTPRSLLQFVDVLNTLAKNDPTQASAAQALANEIQTLNQ